jgi:hypothetical protein
VRRLTFLCYWLAGLGAAVFVLSWPLHSRAAFVGGVGLMVCAVFVMVPVFMADREPETRLQNVAGATWALLFAVWCVAWLAFPALHIRWITLIGSSAFFVSACALIYVHWQARRHEKGDTVRPRRP